MPEAYRKPAMIYKEMLRQENHNTLPEFPWEMPLAAVQPVPAVALTVGGPALGSRLLLRNSCRWCNPCSQELAASLSHKARSRQCSARLLSCSGEVPALTSFVLFPQHLSKHFWPPNKKILFFFLIILSGAQAKPTQTSDSQEGGSGVGMCMKWGARSAQHRKAECVTQGLTDFVAELNYGTIWFMHKDSCNLNITLNGEKWKGRIYLKAPWFLQSNGLP